MDSLQLLILVNVPLEISSGIFVYDEIIQIHTIHKNNHKMIKEPHNGNSKANKKLTKFSCKVYREVFLSRFIKAICFATPNLHFAAPSWVATHSLRSPDLQYLLCSTV